MSGSGQGRKRRGKPPRGRAANQSGRLGSNRRQGAPSPRGGGQPPTEIDPEAPRRFLATAARGTEEVLRDELVSLGFGGVATVPGGVRFDGRITDGMRACLWLRTAGRILMSLGESRVRGPDQLYDAVRALPLTDWYHPKASIAVFARTSDPHLRHSGFTALKTKDAIVDAMRDVHGRRPDVDTKRPDVTMVVHVRDGRARFYLEVNGAPLNQRGYRKRDVEAPLKETLAATMILMSGWAGSGPIHDPMCGSGTLAIEAALIAANRAPGLEREFGFQRWPAFGAIETRWAALREDAASKCRSIRAPIMASDIDGSAVMAARANAHNAGVGDRIMIRKADAREIGPLLGGGTFVLNPPYGERLASDDPMLGKLYDRFGAAMRAHPGHHVTLIAPQALITRAFGDSPLHHIDVRNGKIPCRIATFATSDGR